MEKRLSKSPVLTSRSPALYEKYKSGCAWSLANFFDFQQVHSSGELISDDRGVNRHALDDGFSQNRVNLLLNDEKCRSLKERVNRMTWPVNPWMLEETMACKDQMRRSLVSTGLHSKHSDPGSTLDEPVNHQKMNKKSRKLRYKSLHGCQNVVTVMHGWPLRNNNPVKSSNDFASKTKASRNHVDPKNGCNYESKRNREMPRDKSCGQMINIQVHMNESVETFINQKLSDGTRLSKNGARNWSKNFTDALEILNSNKELFLKLLQDPNSLLVQHIQELRDSQVKKHKGSFSEAEFSECRTNGARECSDPAFSEKLKSGKRYPSKDALRSDTVVLLKPGLASMQNNGNNSLNNEEGNRATFFSFRHMKRKLRNSMWISRKEHRQIPVESKLQKSSWNSQESEHGHEEIKRQIMERHARERDGLNIGSVSRSSDDVNERGEIDQVKNPDSCTDKSIDVAESCDRAFSFSTVGNFKEHESNADFFPKRHPSEIENRGKQTFTSSYSIKSLPEYGFLTTLHPGQYGQYGFATSQLRYSPYSYYLAVKGEKWRVHKEKKSSRFSSLQQSFDAQQQADNKMTDDQLQSVNRGLPLFSDPSLGTELLDSIHSLSEHLQYKGDDSRLEVLSEADGSPNTNTGRKTDIINPLKDHLHFNCTKQESSLNETLISLSSTEWAEDSECTTDQSPVSVADNNLVQDVMSPLRTHSQRAEQPVESLGSNIEDIYSSAFVGMPLDLMSGSGTLMYERGPLSKYIREVLKGLGLNWEELSVKCLLSNELLEPSLYDGPQGWPEKSSCNYRLLFGYVNEVLLELCQHYCKCSPWVAVLYAKRQPFLLSEVIVDEVLKHVDWSLLSGMSEQTLEELVQNDLTKSRAWSGELVDIEDLLTQIVDCVLEDLRIEIAIELQT